jgi:diguanylate cyclase (GGDEF)-like protein
MSEPQKSPMKTVLEHCIQIDQIAIDEYERMSDATSDSEVRKLFADLRADERRHIRWWHTLEREWDEGHIPEVWGDIEALARQLDGAVDELRASLPESYEGMDSRDMLLVAARLEYMALEPAIGAMIDLLGDAEDPTVGSYDEHLRRLMMAIEGHRKFGDPLESFLVRALRRAWHGSTTMAQAALRDPLTGLFNRRALGPLLAHNVATACRYGSPLSLLMIDLDDFKKVNDDFGHSAGDVGLRRTAEVLNTMVRASDFVARFGGDEFVVVAASTDEAAARQLMERIVLGVRESDVSAEGRSLPLTLSIGAALLLPEPGSDVLPEERLLVTADESLYESKMNGRNRWSGPKIIELKAEMR